MDSNTKNKTLIINLKNYLETSGESTIKIAKESEKVRDKTNVEIVIAPPQPSLALLAKNTSLKVIAQHVDTKNYGSTTGFYVPEIVKNVGGSGAIINHSEHEISIDQMKESIDRLRELNLISYLCVKTVNDLKKVLKFNPDYIAIEPSELIGTSQSISMTKPFLISNSKETLIKENSNAQLICGAGISKAEDVRTAIELGASGILVASAITKASNWYNKILELATALY
ncbi:MAG: triose-phosphate isomerase [Thermoproteota archaeon]|nr:triose-phosphate isomerase [Thermoproteota archaeon]